jgi:hypothetical protein
MVQRQNAALVARRRRVGTAWEPQLRSIVQKIGHKPAKLEIPVQVGVDRPFFRACRQLSVTRASNAV